MSKCNDIRSNIPACGIENHLSIEIAGDVVGLNLKDPIDISQMQVRSISVEPVCDDFNEGRRKFIRSTVLRTYIFNEEGEREELIFTIERHSTKMPKVVI